MSGWKSAVKVWRQIKSYGTGYSQGTKQRWSVVKDWATKTLRRNAEVDCSAAWAIGVDMAYGTSLHKGTVWTGNIAALAKKTGFFRVKPYNNSKSPESQGKAGGAFLTPGKHVVSLLDKHECLSPEANEKGKPTGGKPGDQTGREVRIRKWYKRAGGWKYNIVPIPAVEFKGHVLWLAAQGKAWAETVNRLKVVASSDGPLYEQFLGLWAVWNRGMTLSYIAGPAASVGKHAFVVLGAKLNADGTVSKQLQRRLQLALDGARQNPRSIVVVTGGKPYNGVTEGEAGMNWLIGNGLDKSRVFAEEKANSTVGNAAYTMPLLKKLGVDCYTLVSDASHLRRASLLFAAKLLDIRTEGDTNPNRSVNIVPLKPLAYNDYAPKPVATEGPVSAKDRSVIGAEIASVLGLSGYYK